MKKGFVFVLSMVMVFLLCGCCLSHDWIEANCTAPRTCSKCDKTEGEPGDHSWVSATCTAPETCAVCGETRGQTKDHVWNPATCSAAMTCSFCGATEGDALEHRWSSASCTEPETCFLCGEARGEALGHDWQEASALSPKTCSRCKETAGEKLQTENVYPAGTPRYADGHFLMASDEIVALYLDALAAQGYDYFLEYAGDRFGGTTLSYQLESSSGHSIDVFTITDGTQDGVYYVSAKCKSSTDLSEQAVQDILNLMFEVCHGVMTDEKWEYIHQNTEQNRIELGQMFSCVCDDLGYLFVDGSGQYEVCTISNIDVFNDVVASLAK